MESSVTERYLVCAEGGLQHGYAYHFYGIQRDAVILVRPDGHIGLTTGGFDGQPINEYLHRVTGR